MNSTPNSCLLVACSSCALLVLLASGSLQAQSTSLVSFDGTGQLPNDDAYDPVLSAEGRFVAFQWYDNFSRSDIFLCELATGALELISVSSSEIRGDSYSYVPALTPDLRHIAFSSWSTNLVPGDTNGPYPVGHDVFVRDRQLGSTERVSVSSSGAQGNDQSYHPAISADGRLVAFTSYSSNLVPADSNGFEDVFLRDRVANTTTRVSLNVSGGPANGGSFCASISADGVRIVFYGSASNLVAGDTNTSADVFVRNISTGVTERVSVDSNGAQANASSSGGVISPDGRFVVFRSTATNLVAGDTNGKADVFLRDRSSGATERISVGASGAQSDGDSASPALTPDGRYVVFQSNATNLIAGDTNGRWDIFVRDRLLGTTERMSVDSNSAEGTADSGIQGPSISEDGRRIAFDSRARFAAADTDDWHDIYVRERGAPAPAQYCTAGMSSNGCSASLSASASPSASLATPCSISVVGVEGQRVGLLFYGLEHAGWTPSPWAPGSTSWLCVKPPTQRTGAQHSGGSAGLCDGVFALDWNAYQAANAGALGQPWLTGARAYVQAWFRDPPAPKSTGLSNALELTHQP